MVFGEVPAFATFLCRAVGVHYTLRVSLVRITRRVRGSFPRLGIVPGPAGLVYGNWLGWLVVLDPKNFGLCRVGLVGLRHFTTGGHSVQRATFCATLHCW